MPPSVKIARKTGGRFPIVPFLSFQEDSHRFVFLLVFRHSQANGHQRPLFDPPDLDVGDRTDGSLSLRAFGTLHPLHADGQIQEGMFDSSPAVVLWGPPQ